MYGIKHLSITLIDPHKIITRRTGKYRRNKLMTKLTRFSLDLFLVYFGENNLVYLD